MASYVDGNTKSYQVGAAIGQHIRVRLSSGKLAAAGASDSDWLGHTVHETFAADEWVSVRLRSASGTQLVVASEAISLGAEVELGASGKADDYSSGTKLGVTHEAATADGDFIEVLLY